MNKDIAIGLMLESDPRALPEAERMLGESTQRIQELYKEKRDLTILLLTLVKQMGGSVMIDAKSLRGLSSDDALRVDGGNGGPVIITVSHADKDEENALRNARNAGIAYR